MTKAELENGIRNEALEAVQSAVAEHYGISVDELCVISASEFVIPVVDAENNESFVKVAITVPRGTRNGMGGYDAYNPYPLAEAYAEELADRQAKKEAVEAKKRKAEEERQRKREAKKTIKELNKKGLNAMIHEGE
jgi:selenophosphate synthase